LQADKGHRNEVVAFVSALRSGQNMPIDFESLLTTTLVSLAALESIRRGELIVIEDLQNKAIVSAPQCEDSNPAKQTS
jgi:hypothetical protein